MTPSTVPQLLNGAVAAHEAGRLDEAEALYRRLLTLQPNHADASHLLGVLRQQKGDATSAEQLIRRALALREHPLFLGNLGHLLTRLERTQEAEAAYRRSLALAPAAAEIRMALADLLRSLARPQEAIEAYEQVLALKPDSGPALINLGNLLHEVGRLDEAQSTYEKALAVLPATAKAHHNLGILYVGSGRAGHAEASFRKAVAIEPQYASAYNSLGALLKAQNRNDEAEAAYRQAVSLQPDFFEAHVNLGALMHHLQRMQAAEGSYRRALELQPGKPEALFNLGTLLLTQGRFAEGWPLYEARIAVEKSKPTGRPVPAAPRWSGEPLDGKSVLLWPEQGHGDYIQFARYARELKARGARRVTVACVEALSELLGAVPGVDQVVVGWSHLPPHDCWAYAASLPFLCGTTAQTIPARLPYLKVPEERRAKWQACLPEGGPKVGLVWKGSRIHANDANRSLPGLSTLAPLWGIPGIAFISLQKGQAEDEAAQPPPGQPLTAVGAAMADFADTAAIVEQLDLVICVDTAVAHLAGALAKPVWVLLPALGSDWRWLCDREDSPWYPGVMRLFRQATAGDWGNTVASVAEALRAWAGERC